MVRDLSLKQKSRLEKRSIDGKRWGDYGANSKVYTGVRRVEWGKEEQRDWEVENQQKEKGLPDT